MTILDIDRIDDLFPDVVTQTPLFTQPPLIPACLVCGRGGRADMGRPLICDRCGADVPAAQSLVDYKITNAELQLDVAYDAWLTARDTADAGTRKHYDLYEELRIAQNPRSELAEAKAQAGEVGTVFDLIRLWLAKDAAGEQWEAINEWAKQCDEVLR
jgi:hypothetical protein